ncbi:MAG: HD domain-containing protein [bacterium]|nr:HD domain-containing protein [bacterium]
MQTKNTNPSRHLQGKEASAIIELYFDLCHLKQIYRQGWLQHGISPLRCESVADHSFGVAMLVMFLADQYAPELDMAKLLRLSLLHDFGEIDAGDVTPADGVSSAEKVQSEHASVLRVLRRLPEQDRYLALWHEYEVGVTLEAGFVRQVEKLEMALQASVYEHQKLAELGAFFASTKTALDDAQLLTILAAIDALRGETVSKIVPHPRDNG